MHCIYIGDNFCDYLIIKINISIYLVNVFVSVFSGYCPLAYAGANRSFMFIQWGLRLKSTLPPATFLLSPVLQVKTQAFQLASSLLS